MTFKKTLLATALVAASATVSAAPITGAVDFNGQAIYDTGVATTANTINFNSVEVSGNPTGAFGLFLADNDAVTFTTPFQIQPTTQTGILWTAGGFTFELDSLTRDTSGPFLLLSGTGSVTGNGYDETAGVFQFSSQFGASFSANTYVPVPVSEPASIALFGLGLAGLGLARRKQKAA